MRRIGEFAAELYGAPAWLLVESVTIETTDGRPPLRLEADELDHIPFPTGDFTIRVDVRPSVVGRALETI